MNTKLDILSRQWRNFYTAAILLNFCGFLLYFTMDGRALNAVGAFALATFLACMAEIARVREHVKPSYIRHKMLRAKNMTYEMSFFMSFIFLCYLGVFGALLLFTGMATFAVLIFYVLLIALVLEIIQVWIYARYKK